MFRAMYPELDRWLALKAKFDPNNTFVSDLGRRVGLLPGSPPEPARQGQLSDLSAPALAH